MGMHYSLYTPDFKKIDSGKFTNMPFFMNDLPTKFTCIGNVHQTMSGYDTDPYDLLFIITYEQAIKLKEIDGVKSDLFIRLMKENECNGLLIKTG